MTPHPNTDPPKGTNFLDWALRYAAQGWRVFPCVPGGKEPLIAGWPNRATTDPQQIREWWSKHPTANIAIVCGGGLVVLDFDPRSGGDYWEDMNLPPTPTTHTGGGGRHYYFKAPNELRSRKVDAGLDMKGEGGYVIAPPSIHPSGGRYEWEAGAAPWEVQLAPLPAELISEKPEKGPVEKVWDKEVFHEGERNDTLFRYACSLRAKGLDMDEILHLLLRKNTERCSPPLDEKEVRAIARSAARYEPGGGTNSGGSGRKKQTKTARALEVLQGAKWVKYMNNYYIAHGMRLYAIDEAYSYLIKHDILLSRSAAAELAQSVVKDAQGANGVEDITRKVVLVDPTVRYGKTHAVEGIFFLHAGKVFCYTSKGSLVEVQDGVYFRPEAALSFIPEGNLEDLAAYVSLMFANLSSPSNPLVGLAVIAPVVLGLGNAGLLFEGPGGSGKSTAGQALFNLIYQRDAATGVGDSTRDFLSTLVERRVIYHDDLSAMDAIQEDLIRIGITGGSVEVRELYTTMSSREVALSGSAIVCGVSVSFRDTTTIERFIRFGFAPKTTASEHQIKEVITQLAPKALGGLLRLYVEAARVPSPDPTDTGGMRLRDWFYWAVRFARVLGVEGEFRRWLGTMSGELFARMGAWGELYHLLREGNVGEDKIMLGDLAGMILERAGLEVSDTEKRKLARMATERDGQMLRSIATRAGFLVELSKEKEEKTRHKRWFVRFRRIDYQPMAPNELYRRGIELLKTAPLRAANGAYVSAHSFSASGAELATAGQPSLTIKGEVGEGAQPLAPEAEVATEPTAGWIKEVAHIKQHMADQGWRIRQGLYAIQRELLKGVDTESPAGRILKAHMDCLHSVVHQALDLVTHAAILRALPDEPAVEGEKRALELKEREVADRIMALIDTLVKLTNRWGLVRVIARIEAAPGRLWYTAPGFLRTLREVGLDQLADKYADQIQVLDGYKTRRGMAGLAWELWAKKDEMPEVFARIWPTMQTYLENALGEGWPSLLGIPGIT